MHPPFAPVADVVNLRNSWELPDSPRAVRLARQIVAASWRSWGIPGDLMVPLLLTSEVVTNALKHSYPPMRLHLTRQTHDRILVEVCDPSPVPPLARPQTVDPSGGRGLLLLDRLADDWGYHIVQSGKIVWFRVTAETGG